jgi:hypothetical protein
LIRKILNLLGLYFECFSVVIRSIELPAGSMAVTIMGALVLGRKVRCHRQAVDIGWVSCRAFLDDFYGKLANTRGPHGRMPSEWWVHFLDGNDPLTRLFFSEEELRLISCPHVDAGRSWLT